MELNKTQSTGQNRRKKMLIVLSVLAVVLLGAGMFIRSWIRMPEVPELPGIVEIGRAHV